MSDSAAIARQKLEADMRQVQKELWKLFNKFLNEFCILSYVRTNVMMHTRYSRYISRACNENFSGTIMEGDLLWYTINGEEYLMIKYISITNWAGVVDVCIMGSCMVQLLESPLCMMEEQLMHLSSNLFHMHLFTSCTWCRNLS